MIASRTPTGVGVTMGHGSKDPSGRVDLPEMRQGVPHPDRHAAQEPVLLDFLRSPIPADHRPRPHRTRPSVEALRRRAAVRSLRRAMAPRPRTGRSASPGQRSPEQLAREHRLAVSSASLGGPWRDGSAGGWRFAAANRDDASRSRRGAGPRGTRVGGSGNEPFADSRPHGRRARDGFPLAQEVRRRPVVARRAPGPSHSRSASVWGGLGVPLSAGLVDVEVSW